MLIPPNYHTSDVEELIRRGWANATDPHLLKWLKETQGGGRMFQPSLRPYNITDHNFGSFQNSTVFQFYDKYITKFLSVKVSHHILNNLVLINSLSYFSWVI